MEIVAYIGVVLLVIATARGVTRGMWRNRDSERRRLDREGYQQRQANERRERAQAAVGQVVDRFFPFAKAAWEARAGRGDARQRLREVLADTSGIVLGAADVGFDAVLPDATRRQRCPRVRSAVCGPPRSASRLSN